jgi:hypothetical protein
MNHYAELNFVGDARDSKTHGRLFKKIVRTLTMTAIVSTVVVGLIAVSRLAPEQPPDFGSWYVGP